MRHLLLPREMFPHNVAAYRYIAAQIFGAYIACLLIYVQYKEFIHVRWSARLPSKSTSLTSAYLACCRRPQGLGGIRSSDVYT